ncbi:MAG TPA: hypothetical protein VKZ63_06075 [Kofleriaceae bacterium]|nr:hypothetical protein [Kofleriaceae bacterium]
MSEPIAIASVQGAIGQACLARLSDAFAAPGGLMSPFAPMHSSERSPVESGGRDGWASANELAGR